MHFSLRLNSLEDTKILARRLASALVEHPFAVFLDGPLGSGKTTLCRSLVAALPGGDRAEVSSPSFTLYNLYPTNPQVLHCDLYRQGENSLLPEEVEELLAQEKALLLLEWGQYLRKDALPHDVLQIFFDFLSEYGENSRALTMRARGPCASAFLAHVKASSQE